VRVLYRGSWHPMTGRSEQTRAHRRTCETQRRGDRFAAAPPVLGEVREELELAGDRRPRDRRALSFLDVVRATELTAAFSAIACTGFRPLRATRKLLRDLHHPNRSRRGRVRGAGLWAVAKGR
jgi:hypothetical protein